MSEELSDFYADLRKRTDAARREPPSTHDLINRALTEPDENETWESVVALHFRATDEVFEEAKKLCRSDCPHERGLGADILGQLGIPDRLCPDECVSSSDCSASISSSWALSLEGPAGFCFGPALEPADKTEPRP